VNTTIIGAIVGALSISSFIVGAIWSAATYKNKLEILVSENRRAIKALHKDFKYAFSLLETSSEETAENILDIQKFLEKTTDFQVRLRDKKKSNSGANFLEEASKDLL
jgi:hypothetical protein